MSTKPYCYLERLKLKHVGDLHALIFQDGGVTVPFGFKPKKYFIGTLLRCLRYMYLCKADYYVLCDKNSIPIGLVCLTKHRSFYIIGYCLCHVAQGKGYLDSCMDDLKSKLNLPLYARVSANNNYSRAALERNGFKIALTDIEHDKIVYYFKPTI